MPMRSLVGDAREVHRLITDLAERSRADEVMVTTFLPEREDRRRMVTDLAAVFGLREPAPSIATPALVRA